MNTRMFIPALLSAVLLSAPVFAADATGGATPATPATPPSMGASHGAMKSTMQDADQCMSLGKKFDVELKSHSRAAKVAEAKTLRKEGGKLCAAGKHAEGTAKIEQALQDLGVKS